MDRISLMRGGAAVVLFAACSPLPPPYRVTPVRAASDCVETVGQVRARPEAFVVVGPFLEHATPLPTPPPRLHGDTAQVSLRVDEMGRVEPASIVIRGLDDPTFVREVTERIRDYRYAPAVYDGCAVPSQTEFTLSF